MELAKERLEKYAQVNSDKDSMKLSDISNLTGFPLELIRKELLLEDTTGNGNDLELSLGEFRSAMLGYLDKTFDIPS